MKTYVITCPDNLEPEAVKTSLFGSGLRACTRWPEMAGCGQECLSQIRSAPHDCLVQSIVARWYENRQCCFCHRPIAKIVWHERPPALRMPNGITREWMDVAPEELPKVFNDAEAVCWPCHLVETFRREHPGWVLERVMTPEPRKVLPPSANVY